MCILRRAEGVGFVTPHIPSLISYRLMSTMTLGDVCAYLCSSCDFLMALTSSGTLHLW